MSKKNKLNFEDALEELESIVGTMEQGQLSLEELVDHFERGTKLQRHCGDILNRISSRIEKLKNNSSASEPVENSTEPEDDTNDDKDELLF